MRKGFYKKGTTTVFVTFDNDEVKLLVDRAGEKSIGSWIKKVAMREVQGYDSGEEILDEEKYDAIPPSIWKDDE